MKNRDENIFFFIGSVGFMSEIFFINVLRQYLGLDNNCLFAVPHRARWRRDWWCDNTGERLPRVGGRGSCDLLGAKGHGGAQWNRTRQDYCQEWVNSAINHVNCWEFWKLPIFERGVWNNWKLSFLHLFSSSSLIIISDFLLEERSSIF